MLLPLVVFVLVRFAFGATKSLQRPRRGPAEVGRPRRRSLLAGAAATAGPGALHPPLPPLPGRDRRNPLSTRQVAVGGAVASTTSTPPAAGGGGAGLRPHARPARSIGLKSVPSLLCLVVVSLVALGATKGTGPSCACGAAHKRQGHPLSLWSSVRSPLPLPPRARLPGERVPARDRSNPLTSCLAGVGVGGCVNWV